MKAAFIYIGEFSFEIGRWFGIQWHCTVWKGAKFVYHQGGFDSADNAVAWATHFK